MIKNRIKGIERYPLVLMLEPLFRCNLACPGCGKIDYDESVLNRRLSLDDCVSAVEECGAPIVSIPGGEPLLHSEMSSIVAASISLISAFKLPSDANLAVVSAKPSPFPL